MKRGIFLLFFLVSLALSYGAYKVLAVNYGNVNIISDGVMNNTGSMSAGQINLFLNQFTGTCLGTNSGFTTPDPKGFSSGAYQYGGSVDAGTAIRDISVHYNVNPQVLLASLEKEEGLIDRNGNCLYANPDPAPATYNGQPVTCGYNTTYTDCSYACQNSPAGGCVAVALGYACPLFCKKIFNGFSPQISGATWVFRFAQARAEGLMTGYAGYDSGDENICYSGPMTPGYRQRSSSSSTCNGVPGNQLIYYDGSYTDADGNTMYISNGATASMLNYTPFYARSYTNDKLFHTSFTNWFGDPVTGSRWQAMTDPRVMVTNKPTYKVDPETGQQVQTLQSGLQIALQTKTVLVDGTTGCLRTQFDTIHNANACIKIADLDEFTPTIDNIKSDGTPILGLTNQWTCKVSYHSLSVTKNCFGIRTLVLFLKKTTIAGVDYLITNADYNNSIQYAFRADRITLLPNDTPLSSNEKIQANTVWTCKIDLTTKEIVQSQCYKAGTTVNFSRKTTLSGTDYLITEYDNTYGNNYGFLAQRFVPVQ